MRINIGIDGRPLVGNRTGVGQYVYNLCKELDKILPEAHFFIYSPVNIKMPVESERWKIKVDTNSIAKLLKPVVWLKTRVPHLCQEDRLHVFWGAATFLPILPKKIGTVSTVYDLVYKVAPNTMSISHLWSYRIFFKGDVLKSDKVLAISKGTSQRMHQYIGRIADDIVLPSINHKLFKHQSMESVREIKEKYALYFPYLISVATWEPRKNLEILIKSFIQLKKDGLLPGYRLILVGGKGWKDTRIQMLVSTLKEFVVPLGYVPDSDLPSLYAGADMFILASSYEGFGMPVAEASACGTRVLTSDTPELREAGGEGAVYVEPTLEGIKRGIIKGLSIDKNFKHIRDSWEDSAAILADNLLKTIKC